MRDELLRQPLGLSLYEEDLQVEEEQWHFGLFEKEALLACGVVVLLGGKLVKIRQVAVVENLQGRGYGRMLMEAIEGELRQRGYLGVELHARREVVQFYLAGDYVVEGCLLYTSPSPRDRG